MEPLNLSGLDRGHPPDLQAWIEVRECPRLSHAHVQMARELGLNPKKLGKLDNHRQQPWNAPLAEFMEDLYVRRFRRMATERATKQAKREVAKAAVRSEPDRGGPFDE